MRSQRWIAPVVALILAFGAYGCEGEVNVDENDGGGTERQEGGDGGVDLEGELGGEGEGEGGGD